MDDLISRRAVLDKVGDWDYDMNDPEDAWMAEHEIKTMPSVEPDRTKGHWVLDFAQNKMTCSECGRTFEGGFDLDNADNFCRHCGSDNRGERWIRM